MALLGSAASTSLLLSGTAWAQQAAPEESVATAEGDAEAVAEDDNDSNRRTIVVTGSRIRRDGLDAPNPTVAVGAAEIEQGGITNVVDLLNDLPQISTGLSNANTSFSFGNVGLSQIDLRNLGVRRTLTLVNSRRRGGRRQHHPEGQFRGDQG